MWTSNGLFCCSLSASVRQAADGTGKAEPLGAGGFPSGVTPNGKVLFNFDRDVKMLTLDGTHHVESLITGPATERNGVVSPNRRWLAYETNISGEFGINVTPYPNVSGGGPW